MRSTKLDYLSKYADDKDEKRKKKKKKKSKKSEKYQKKSRQQESRIHDDGDLDWIGNKREEDDDDEEQDDDDGPVVVPMEERNGYAVRSSRSQWEEEVDEKRLRRQRHDSEDDEENNDDNNESHEKRRHRHDSDEELDPSGPRRKRHDSDDDPTNEPGGKKDSSTLQRRRRRYDSDDDSDDESDCDKTSQSRRRYSSDDDNQRDRKPADNKRRRYDSDDDHQDNQDRNIRNAKRKRFDSDDEGDSDENENRGSDIDIDDGKKRMASGHAAGLQKAEDFRKAEHKIQRRRHDSAQAMVDKHGIGETVYRDELGRKVAEIQQKRLPQMDKAEQAALNKGRVQKLQEEKRRQEWKEVQASSFARHADDDKLEQQRKHVIREGDPMATYAMKTQQREDKKKKKKDNGSVPIPQRPFYKGPPPKPNRFGIRPGYRWDGVDRGNGFEDKVLANKFGAKHKQEEAYKWSAADM